MLVVASIPIDPPQGTPPPPIGQLLEDVQMAETSTPAPEGGSNGTGNGMNGLNGYASGADDMVVDTPTPAAASSARQSPMESVNGTLAATSHPVQMNGDSDQPPPAKRPRTLSDAEQASLANVSRLMHGYAFPFLLSKFYRCRLPLLSRP